MAGLVTRTARRPGPEAPRAWWVFHFWLAANVVYVLGCANLHFAHKHYQIVFVPALAVLAARALVPVCARWRGACVALAGVVLLYDIGMGFHLWCGQRDPLVERAAAAVRAVSAPDDRVLVAAFHEAGMRSYSRHNDPLWLYHAGRRGWNIPFFAMFTPELVEQYRRRGARWLLMTTSDEALRKLADELRGRYACVRAGEGFVVFDLR